MSTMTNDAGMASESLLSRELSKIDSAKFFGTLALVLLGTIPMLSAPEATGEVINAAFAFITQKLGWTYMLAGIGSLIWCGWLAFGRYGNKKLGENVEYSDFAWIAMLLCAGVGAGIMYGGMIDWGYLINIGINGTEPGSAAAAEWAATYGIFHWGPIAWAMYASLAVPIGYSFFVKKTPVLNISQCCRGLLGDKVDGSIGKIIDILFMMGLIGGAATSLGLGTPVVAAGLSAVFGIPHDFTLELYILIAVTVVFGISSYVGIEKGLKVLSDWNVKFTIGLLAFVLIAGPTVFIMKMGVTSLGMVVANFLDMSTYMDPIEEKGLVTGWTVFYWAWWASYAPFMSMFIAKISRGRTVRQMLLGALIFASVGCAAFYIIFGNFGLNLQLTGQLDVISLLQEHKGATVVMKMAEFLPFSKIFMLLFAIICGVFMATTFDAVTFALSATTTRRMTPEDEPAKWNRLFWALALGLLPLGILLIDGPLSILQTASIVVGLPVMVIVCMGISSFLKEMGRTGWIAK